MTTLMQAHRQWSSRAEDERFTSLVELQAFKRRVCEQSHSTVISSRKLAIEPTPDVVRGLMVVGDDAYDAAALTHWSFGQLCSLASPSNSPASYFRDMNMPAPVIADCFNYNLRFTRGVEDVGILLTEDGHVTELLRHAAGRRAATATLGRLARLPAGRDPGGPNSRDRQPQHIRVHQPGQVRPSSNPGRHGHPRAERPRSADPEESKPGSSADRRCRGRALCHALPSRAPRRGRYLCQR